MVSAVVQSMQLRGNGAFSTSAIKFVNKPTTFSRHIAAIKALQQATNKPVYIVGVISSVNVKGVKIALPTNLHYYNRLPFCKMQKRLLKHGIYSINPACLYTFASAIKANPIGFNLRTCPQMFNTSFTTPAKQLQAIQRLQRANKRHASGCCAIVVVHYPISMLSNGVQMELLAALKHNKGVRIYRAY